MCQTKVYQMKESLMKNLSLLLTLIVAVSCSHFSGRDPSSLSDKPRHLIITIHGLSGNQETFGYFGEATKKFMSELNPNDQIETMNFIYPSGRNEKNGTSEFAESLSVFIKEQFKNQPLKPLDRISFVAHSQGGIIASMWFFQSILQQSADLAYVKQIDSIITLGTPFWGSKVSSILTDRRNPDVIPLIKLFAPDNFKMTKREIADIAYASDTVNIFRTLAIRLDTDPELSRQIENLPVRMINITGILPKDKSDLFSTANSRSLVSDLTKRIINSVYKIYQKSYSGNLRVESDIAVPVPSSRWDFIYTPTHVINQDTTISSTDYKNFTHLLNRSKVLFTESAHLPFDTENTLSMAYINKSCLAVETCNHPTYRYILEHLANCKDTNNCDQYAYQNIIQKMKAINLNEYNEFKAIENTLESFSIQINMKLKPGQIDQFPVEYFIMKNRGEGETIGYDSWEFNEYSLQGKVIDLKTDKKTQVSFASKENFKIVLADKDEKHSIDIVSRKATLTDPFDRLRVNITGRIEDSQKNVSKTYVAPIEIKLPGLPVVKLNNLVKPSYSTFTELDYSQ